MYQRELSRELARRLQEPRRFMQVVSGPRQTGKTTAIKQAIQRVGIPVRVANADSPTPRGEAWLEAEWRQARALSSGSAPAVLVIDEVQKIDQWSEVVKRLWDEDSWSGLPLLVVLSGSSSLLMREGLSESLAGRFEILHSTHWTLAEMREAFGYGLNEYLLYGGYPGAASLIDNPERWTDYMRDSIIEATVSKDVLQMESVRKPALLRNLFYLGAQFSAQEISYRKLLGQLDDKGNTDTIAHYLELLSGAGLMTGLKKYDPKAAEKRASSPRLMVHDPSLMSAAWEGGLDDLLSDSALRGHLVETAVGATLLAWSRTQRFDLCWWRDKDDEVDFVISKGSKLTAIEVKSGRVKRTGGLEEFCRRFPNARPVIVGDRNTSVEDFLEGGVPLFA